MAITTFSNGDIPNETQLNVNFQRGIVRSNSDSQDTAEYTVATGASWADIGYSKTFTCPETANIILGLKLEFDYKAPNTSEYIAIRAKLTNNTSGTVSILTNTVFAYPSVAGLANSIITTYSTFSGYVPLMNVLGTTINSLSNADALYQGTTYTLTFEAYRNGSSGTIYITNITPTILWSYVEDDVVSGWA